jgi:diacylglycerol kinase family enzyme
MAGGDELGAFERSIVIANPAARGGAVGRAWPKLARRLERAAEGRDLALWRTEGPRHAVALAREAARSGVTRVLSLGGDGTHGEVAEGLATSGIDGVALGPLPAGTGGDLVRMLPRRSIEAHIGAMLRAKPVRIDLGRVSLTSETGDPVVRHFVNVASVGLSGLVDRAMTPALRRLGGKLGFFAATVRVLARAEPPELAIEVDGAPFAEGRFGVVTVANGRFAGGGMRFAPEAALDDGHLDVTAIGGRGMTSLLAHAPALYRGSIAKRAGVVTRDAKFGRIVPLRGSEAWIDVDGECPGGGVLTFEVVPAAIGFVGLA